jgi:hypothetical protein
MYYLNNRVNNIFTKLFIIFILIFITFFNIFSEDNSDDVISISDQTDDDLYLNDNNKKKSVIFDLGGSLSTTSRILFKTFQISSNNEGIEPVPNDKWYADVAANLWTRIQFKQNGYLHLGIEGLVKADRYNDKFDRNSIVPLFNVDELYFNWGFKPGKVILGRTNYNLKNALIFNGPLDGVELDINLAQFNFKTFAGFTGFLGIFNPWFNPYAITPLERSYKEETNLIYGTNLIQINAEQARRLFIGSDFDIQLFSQHINPYFLLQFDLSSIYHDLNRNNDVNTFHIGFNLEGRIVRNLFYKVHLCGLFGTNPTSSDNVFRPIIAGAIETNLRIVMPKAANSTFIFGYSVGTGNGEPKGKWSDDSDDEDKGFWSEKYDGKYNNKFIYFGKFDGGYALNPILSNINSFSVKFLITPVHNSRFQWTIYNAIYQTLKLFSTGPISDDECDLNDYFVGMEFDMGMMFNFGSYLNLAIDYGVFMPQTAYSDRSPKFKMGASFGVTF